MSEHKITEIGLYPIFLENDFAVIMHLYDNAEINTICITFSRVGGRSFLQQCLKDGVFSKVDFESFEQTWESLKFPDFHLEEETIVDGHAADRLCVYLGTYADLANEGYNLKEVYQLFQSESCAEYSIPFYLKWRQTDYKPKDLSAIMVDHQRDTVKCLFDKRDALILLDLYESRYYKKQTRKEIMHSALPYESIEPVRTYTGLTGELISYLFWVDQEFR